ncbi:gp121 [Sphingomonas phage PAU]|uniref:gp121 n=1 Tax=Sphingomonas phage PAU TaxID=1150991 RepID=UPI000257326C|nr:gp121 [Sphingomonas phage PAU]AFF28119.1 gp121 [Sphingomonas phage PAU]
MQQKLNELLKSSEHIVQKTFDIELKHRLRFDKNGDVTIRFYTELKDRKHHQYSSPRLLDDSKHLEISKHLESFAKGVNLYKDSVTKFLKSEEIGWNPFKEDKTSKSGKALNMKVNIYELGTMVDITWCKVFKYKDELNEAQRLIRDKMEEMKVGTSYVSRLTGLSERFIKSQLDGTDKKLSIDDAIKFSSILRINVEHLLSAQNVKITAS